MAGRVFKHPDEVRTHTFDFSGGGSLGLRGARWSDRLLNTAGGELFRPALTLPLLFGSMGASSPTPVFTAVRADFQPYNSDLLLSNGAVAGNYVTVTVGGGFNGRVYRVQCQVTSNLNNVLIMQGLLEIRENLAG